MEELFVLLIIFLIFVGGFSRAICFCPPPHPRKKNVNAVIGGVVLRLCTRLVSIARFVAHLGGCFLGQNRVRKYVSTNLLAFR